MWKNADYAGRASGVAFGENAIYLCGQYGPDLCGELWDSCFGTYAELYEYEGNGAVVHGGGMGSDRIEHMYVQQLVNNSLTEGEFSVSTEEISFDELYSMLKGYTFIDNFYRLTDCSVLGG